MVLIDKVFLTPNTNTDTLSLHISCGSLRADFSFIKTIPYLNTVASCFTFTPSLSCLHCILYLHLQVFTRAKLLSDLDSASMPNIYTKITSLKVCTVKICIYKILKKKEKGMLCMGLFINKDTLLVKFMVVREICHTYLQP